LEGAVEKGLEQVLRLALLDAQPLESVDDVGELLLEEEFSFRCSHVFAPCSLKERPAVHCSTAGGRLVQ
jgi:hypothetical protein